MSAGRLIHFIELERLSRVEDAEGGYVETWDPVTPEPIPCRVTPLAATSVERKYGDVRVEAPMTHEVVFRWGDHFEPLATDRAIFRGRALNVRGVEQVEETLRYWRLLCVQDVA